MATFVLVVERTLSMQIRHHPERSASVVDTAQLTDSEARALRRAAEVGAAFRVRRGAFAPADTWSQLDAAQQHLERLRAELSFRTLAYVVAHESAALLWGYAAINARGIPLHFISPSPTAARSTPTVTLHRERVDAAEVTQWWGLTVTTPARTLVDVARTAGFRDSVVALDSALRAKRTGDIRDAGRAVVERWQLDEALALHASARGHARAARAVSFASVGVDSVGESLSRMVLADLGFPAPLLQVEHPNPEGGRYFVDFEWPEWRLIGEFDGRGKYLKDDLLRGMTPGEAVYAEKVREDHLRAEGNRVVRWGMGELRSPQRLAALLTRAGLPRRRNRV